MRILLTANASYVPPRGGATRSNLVWLGHLATHGHECRVVAASLDRAHAVSKTGEGVIVHSAADPAEQVVLLREQIREFRPDWVLVSSEDLGHTLLREAHHQAPGRVVYLAHTPQFFPFGPESWNREPDGVDLVKRAAAVVAIGRHTAAYVREHAGCDPVIVHPPIYGSGPYRKLGSFGAGLIAMINPCAVKGIAIFLALAERFPEYRFGALPGWGTTAADLRAIEKLPNITLLSGAKDIEDILSRIGVLLMPSVWMEGFGLIVIESMLRGVPVISSDAGGLLEAKMGTRFVLHVPPVERYEPVFDERAMPRPVIPPIDIAPWEQALRTLMSDRAAYEDESRGSAEAALRFVDGLRPDQLEEVLQRGGSSTCPAQAGDLRHGMRILLAHNSLYYPAHGGGDRSNRLLMEALAARGHDCRVVARIAGVGPEEHRRFLEELAARSVPVISSDGGVVVFRHNGVEVHAVTNNPHLRSYFAGQAAEFAPTVILASTDDPAQLLLEAALRAEHAKVVYLARATLALPFGPDCAFPSAAKTESLRQADGVVGVSHYVADYIRRWSGIEALSLPISLLEPGSYPQLGRFDNEFVTMVNPCAVKGISIFLALAERLPEVQFAAVPTWGTNQADRAALGQHPNIRVLDPVDDVDEILARTRVLLAPSLWAEARSRIVVEAMLRGVPVVASNVGGIPEAKMGVDYLLPVRPIEKYRPRVDEQMVPVADVPEQDIAPWQEALTRLLTDRAHYEEISRASREAALQYASSLGIAPFESFVRETPRRRDRKSSATFPAEAPRHTPLDNLSPEKLRLLALRLRKKQSVAAANWFPTADEAGERQLRLFCFPHAGGGALAYHGWAKKLPAAALPCAVRLPGRESRLGEAPFLAMAPLVEALFEAMAPFLGHPFAFFGHSMGAVIGFELARLLRKHNRPLPRFLMASGARAPQFRLGHVPPPEPSEEAFIAELRNLEGVPREIFDNQELMRVILPTLRADTTLYRNYVYGEEPPLPFPIRAYGGCGDVHVTRAHLEAWGKQTTSSFALRLFPGGHFFLQTEQAAFLEALAQDLDA